MYLALRYNPSTSGATRFALVDTYLPHGSGPEQDREVRIPKGTLILTSAATVHRDQGVWDDPDEFRPDRWRETDARQRVFIGSGRLPHVEYMPFSFGSRKCPGEKYALLVAKYFLVRLYQTFPLILPGDNRPYKATTRVGTTIRNGLWLKFHRERTELGSSISAADEGPLSNGEGNGQDNPDEESSSYSSRQILAGHGTSSEVSRDPKESTGSSSRAPTNLASSSDEFVGDDVGLTRIEDGVIQDTIVVARYADED